MVQLKRISLSNIDLSVQTYRITRAGEDLPALALSISRLGICTPPAVIETGDGASYSVVSGFRRIQALSSLNTGEVDCRVFPPEAQERCACLAVAENAYARELAPGEMVRAAVILGRHMDAGAIADESPNLFNTRLNKGYIETLLSIAALGPEVQGLLDHGLLAIRTAKILTQLPPSDARAFLSLFSGIKASTGKQMEMVTWAREIAARDGVPLSHLLTEPPLREALDSEGANRDAGAAANRVRACLFARRFPELDQARKRSAALVRDLKLPANIRLNLPENFESTVYGLTLNITNLEDLNKGLDDIARLAAHGSFKQILDR